MQILRPPWMMGASLILLGSGVVLIGAFLWSGADSKPVFRSLTPFDIDLGVLPATNEDRVIEIRVENIGNAPLKIMAGRSSCTCTTINLKSPITLGPRSQDMIEIKMGAPQDPRFERFVQLVTDDPLNPRVDYRIHGRLGRRISWSPAQIDVVLSGGIPIKSTVCFVVMDPSFRVTAARCTVPEVALRPDAQVVGGRYTVAVVVHPTDAGKSRRGEILLDTNAEALAEVRIPISIDEPPRLNADPPYFRIEIDSSLAISINSVSVSDLSVVSPDDVRVDAAQDGLRARVITEDSSTVIELDYDPAELLHSASGLAGSVYVAAPDGATVSIPIVIVRPAP